jgi:hypothetical protein
VNAPTDKIRGLRANHADLTPEAPKWDANGIAFRAAAPIGISAARALPGRDALEPMSLPPWPLKCKSGSGVRR